MWRFYPALKWITATTAGLIVGAIAEWLKTDTTPEHLLFIIGHLRWFATPVAAIFGLTAWAYFDDRWRRAQAPGVPHQLRPPPPDFIGRGDDLKALLRAMRRQREKVLALRGMPGIGKTALALRLAEILAPSYPDGQIYLDLKGAPHKQDPAGVIPLTVGDAMDHVIRSYQPEAPVLQDDNQREAAYRTTLFGKRVLLLMDNARDRDQVERLIPPAGCVMIVTSRDHFALPGSKEKEILELPPEDARNLILEITRSTHGPRVQPYADEFARLCDYLPEALRATASAIAEHPDTDPQVFLRRMNDAKERLKLTGVELSLTTSSALLDGQLRNRWHMLSVFPGAFDDAGAAAVWEADADAAKEELSTLVRYSLLEWNPATSRYRLHDLAHDFAALQLDEPSRFAAQGRHATHYKDVLAAAGQKYLAGGAVMLEGLALFDLEWSNIQAGQAWAAAHSESDGLAAELCAAYPDSGAYVLSLRQPPRERIRWLEAALDSAHKLGNRGGEGAVLGNLGNAYFALGEYHRAIEFHERHLKVAREIGHRQGEGIALGNLGNAYSALGDYRRAIEFYEQHLKLAREIGDRQGEGMTLGNLGIAYFSLGETRRAIEFYQQHLAIAREIGDRQGEGTALGNLGNAYTALGEYRRAIEFYEQQLKIARALGDREGEGNALFNSALTLNQLGDRTEAIHNAELALGIYEEIESPEAEKARKQLAAWRK